MRPMRPQRIADASATKFDIEQVFAEVIPQDYTAQE
jgi:hypothetical protein